MTLVMKHSEVGGCALRPLIASNLNQTTSYYKSDDIIAVKTISFIHIHSIREL